VLDWGVNLFTSYASGRGGDENDDVAIKRVWRRSSMTAGTWPCRRRVICTEEDEDDAPLLLLKRIGMVEVDRLCSRAGLLLGRFSGLWSGKLLLFFSVSFSFSEFFLLILI
jgi:hypothetical protein